MKKALLALSLVAATSVAAVAADDPIAARKALMQSNGAAVAASAALMKGDIAYNPAVAKAAISALHATALTFGDFFPEGSDAGDTKASPKIWEDAAGFEAELAKFETATAAAMSAAGGSGPADLDAFKAVILPVMGSCKSCHQGYQVN